MLKNTPKTANFLHEESPCKKNRDQQGSSPRPAYVSANRQVSRFCLLYLIEKVQNVTVKSATEKGARITESEPFFFWLLIFKILTSELKAKDDNQEKKSVSQLGGFHV